MPWLGSRSRRWASTIVLAGALLAVCTPYAGATVPAAGRTWELVTPAQPTSGRTFAIHPFGEDSDRFAYSSFGPFPGSEAGPFGDWVIAERGPIGWLSTPISFPYSVYEMEELGLDLMPIFPAAFSGDLHTVLWLASIPLTPDGPPERELALYRKAPGEEFEFVAWVGSGVTFLYGGFADIASDGGRVVFTTKRHLLPADAGRTEGASIYAWENGGLELVDVDNGGALLSTCGTLLSTANGMSVSADLAFFTVPAACAGVAKIYVRDLETGTTTQISASQCTRLDCNAPADATFAGALRDGSIAFLTTKQQLTNDDHDAGNDLYRYETATGELTLLSGGSVEASGEVGAGLVFPSDDGGRVYFRATGEVVPDEATSGEKLFLADSNGLRLVAEATFPPRAEVQLSADGTRAVFVTKSKVLPSDTDSESDVYLFDAGQETLTRISTGSSGGNGPYSAAVDSPVKRPEFETMGDERPYYAIDESGERVFLWTAEQLIPEDTNGKIDVYEWWNGELGLISSGDGDLDTGFVGASRDGRSVLIVTNSTLIPADVDGGNRDFYIARLEGGFPEPEEPPTCDVVLCPGPPREKLVRPTPASMASIPRKRGHLRVIRVRSKGGNAVGRSTIVLAAVPRPGLVSASAWIREGARKVVLAAGSTGAARPGQVRIGLHLTRAGRQFSGAPARGGHLTVRAGDSTITQSVMLRLG